jgi:hypothetical protein
VNDDSPFNGKQQNWPWIAVDDHGVVSIVYYDNRNTSDCEITETWLAYSLDGGNSFTNILLSTAQSPKNMPNGAVRFGDYIGLDSWGGRTVPVWTDERAGGFDMDIYTAVLDTLFNPYFCGLKYELMPGWNMLSVPLEPANDSVSAVFPDELTKAYAWNGEYMLRDTISHGAGYWFKITWPRVYAVYGDPVVVDTLAVVEGWNLIGGPFTPVPTGSILSDPPGISTSNFFSFNRPDWWNGAYGASDTLWPGLAYWVKSDQAGVLILDGGTTLLPRAGPINVRPSAEQPPPLKR